MKFPLIKFPLPIKKGDKIGLVAPSGPLTDQRRESCLNTIIEMGLEPVTGTSFYETCDFLAGADNLRAADINSFFADKTIKGIFAVRGGYGSQRIIHLLDKAAIINNPKIFLGYSDITALHIFLNQLGLATFHAPMPGADFYNGLDYLSKESFKSNIFGLENEFIYNSGKCLNSLSATGILCGGNLSVIASSIGTECELDFAEKIVFLEDVSEEPYKIDRMLNQLARHGSLEKAAGFIIGYLTKCKPKSSSGFSAEKIISDALLPLNKPCVFGFPAGHENPNLTFPLGVMAEISGNQILIKNSSAP